MNFDPAASFRAFDQQRCVLGSYDHTAGLIDQQHLFPNDTPAGLAAVSLVSEDDLDEHLITRKQGRFKSYLVPTERCDRSSLVHLALESFHERETIQSVRYGTAKTSGPAKVLVGVQRVFVQSDSGERKDVLIRNDVRRGRKFGTHFHIVVVELGDLHAGHLCFPDTIGYVIAPIRTQRN